jgi:putative ABC transport system permease protein
MEAFAINNIYQRVQQRISLKLKKVIALAMVIGTLVSMVYFIIIVINLRPWYEARYFIPLAGMLIGNSMMGMGIVFLPGMMTGQILSGSSPLTAIKYQIVIMLGILASVSLTVFILVNLGYKTLFNERAQLEIK